jgi:4-hydroxyphenylpyruvate dioxygenase-like putative hemolysin
MFQTWENPMGTDGFEFIEYAAPDPFALRKLFTITRTWSFTGKAGLTSL